MISAHLFHAAITLLNTRKNRILLIAQSSLPEHQFQAFKKLLLNELGERGLEQELKSLLLQKQHGMDGNGRE